MRFDAMGFRILFAVGAVLGICPVVVHARSPLPTVITSVAGASLSPDGELAAVVLSFCGSSGGGHYVSVLDIATGRELQSLPLGGYFSGSIPFTPDSRCLLVPTGVSVSLKAAQDRKDEEGQTLRLWDAVKGEEVRVFERPRERDSAIYCMGLSPDGKRALALCTDRKLRVWEVKSGKLVRALDAENHAGEMAVCSPNGKQALMGSHTFVAGAKLTQWDLEEGKVIRSSTGGLTNKDAPDSTWGCTIAFSPSGKWAAVDRTITYAKGKSPEDLMTVWDTETGKVVCDLSCEATVAVFLPECKKLRCGSYDKDLNFRIETWDLETGKLVASKQTFKLERPDAMANPTVAAFSADGTRLLTARGISTAAGGAGDDLVIKLWDADTGKLIRTLRQPEKPATAPAEMRNIRAHEKN
jgi:WD40 repeat protein